MSGTFPSGLEEARKTNKKLCLHICVCIFMHFPGAFAVLAMRNPRPRDVRSEQVLILLDPVWQDMRSATETFFTLFCSPRPTWTEEVKRHPR